MYLRNVIRRKIVSIPVAVLRAGQLHPARFKMKLSLHHEENYKCQDYNKLESERPQSSPLVERSPTPRGM